MITSGMVTSGTQILLIFLLAQALPGHARRHQQSAALTAMDKVAGECFDKANKGEWDYECSKSVVSGSTYEKKYCEYYKSRIFVTGIGGVSKHCAETSDSYCSALAGAGILHGHCLGSNGNDRKKDAKGYFSTICAVSSHSTVGDWLDSIAAKSCSAKKTQSEIKGCRNNIYKRCIKYGPVDFCAALRSEERYESGCVSRIPHRSDDDDYCTCNVVGDKHMTNKLFRCNERQDKTNDMDRWDNECLRRCSGYPHELMGWYCTPVKKTGLSYSTKGYNGNLTQFGDMKHAIHAFDGIKKEQEEKRAARRK